MSVTGVMNATLGQNTQIVERALKPGTFVTAPGLYHWANASAVGELTLRNNKTRSITLGISQAPPPGTTIVNYWTNAPSESKLTISGNAVNLVTSDDSHSSSAGITTWQPGRNWFIYRANGMRVWAYDGGGGLWMLTATPLGSESASIENLQEQPPAAVLKRLPDTVKRMLPGPDP